MGSLLYINIHKSDEQAVDYLEDAAYTLPYLLLLRSYAAAQSSMEEYEVSMWGLQQLVSRGFVEDVLV